MKWNVLYKHHQDLWYIICSAIKFYLKLEDQQHGCHCGLPYDPEAETTPTFLCLKTMPVYLM